MEMKDSWSSEPKKGISSRRAHVRFPLRVSVGFQWGEGGNKRDGRGWTRNLSEEGAFIETAKCPAEGESVDLLFRIPRARRPTSIRAIRVVMEARVVRVQVEEDTRGAVKVGFAVQKHPTVASQPAQTHDAAWTTDYGSQFRYN